jgi:hypothetical protein
LVVGAVVVSLLAIVVPVLAVTIVSIVAPVIPVVVSVVIPVVSIVASIAGIVAIVPVIVPITSNVIAVVIGRVVILAILVVTPIVIAAVVVSVRVLAIVSIVVALVVIVGASVVVTFLGVIIVAGGYVFTVLRFLLLDVLSPALRSPVTARDPAARRRRAEHQQGCHPDHDKLDRLQVSRWCGIRVDSRWLRIAAVRRVFRNGRIHGLPLSSSNVLPDVSLATLNGGQKSIRML